jgi:hypothetical protein
VLVDGARSADSGLAEVALAAMRVEQALHAALVEAAAQGGGGAGALGAGGAAMLLAGAGHAGARAAAMAGRTVDVLQALGATARGTVRSGGAGALGAEGATALGGNAGQTGPVVAVLAEGAVAVVAAFAAGRAGGIAEGLGRPDAALAGRTAVLVRPAGLAQGSLAELAGATVQVVRADDAGGPVAGGAWRACLAQRTAMVIARAGDAQPFLAEVSGAAVGIQRALHALALPAMRGRALAGLAGWSAAGIRVAGHALAEQAMSARPAALAAGAAVEVILVDAITVTAHLSRGAALAAAAAVIHVGEDIHALPVAGLLSALAGGADLAPGAGSDGQSRRD